MIINFLIIIQEITMKILTLSVAAYNIENYIENMIEKICDCDFLNITLRRSRLSGVARATLPDRQSHLVINYCIMF